MSIVIEEMDMPKCCSSCEFNNGYRCTRTETVIDRDYEYQERLSDCPLHEESKEWIPVCYPPKEKGKYLVTLSLAGVASQIAIRRYAPNLQEVDPHDFYGENKAGWYSYDSECGYSETTAVVAWMPLPETYKAESEG